MAAGYVATNASDYTGLLTNLLAFHGESNIYLREDGTNIYYGESVTIAAGVTAGTYYDGANGAAASNLAAAALPKAGETMTGDIDGGANDATNFANIDALDTRIGALEVPYQSFTSTNTPDAGGTCTIAYASGSLVKIDANTNITLTFDNTNFPTNGVNRVGVEIWSSTNTVSFLDAIVTNETELVFTNKSPASLFFRKTGTNTLWWGRQ